MQFRTSQQIDKIFQINLKYEVRSKFNPLTQLELNQNHVQASDEQDHKIKYKVSAKPLPKFIKI